MSLEVGFVERLAFFLFYMHSKFCSRGGSKYKINYLYPGSIFFPVFKRKFIDEDDFLEPKDGKTTRSKRGWFGNFSPLVYEPEQEWMDVYRRSENNNFGKRLTGSFQNRYNEVEISPSFRPQYTGFN